MHASAIITIAAAAVLAGALFGAGFATAWIWSHRHRLPAHARRQLFGP